MAQTSIRICDESLLPQHTTTDRLQHNNPDNTSLDNTHTTETQMSQIMGVQVIKPKTMARQTRESGDYFHLIQKFSNLTRDFNDCMRRSFNEKSPKSLALSKFRGSNNESQDENPASENPL